MLMDRKMILHNLIDQKIVARDDILVEIEVLTTEDLQAALDREIIDDDFRVIGRRGD